MFSKTCQEDKRDVETVPSFLELTVQWGESESK